MRSYYSEFYDYANSKKGDSIKWERIFNRMQQDDFDIVLDRDNTHYWIRMQVYAKTISQDFRKELEKYMHSKGILQLA